MARYTKVANALYGSHSTSPTTPSYGSHAGYYDSNKAPAPKADSYSEEEYPRSTGKSYRKPSKSPNRKGLKPT